MKAFIDTNVAISYTVELDSFNKKSQQIFEKYSNLYWCYKVQNEFFKVFYRKINYYKRFFKRFMEHIIKNCLSFDEYEIENYVNSIETTIKKRESLKKSFFLFWDKYVKNKNPEISDLVVAIEKLLKDIEKSPYINKKRLCEKMELTPKRNSSYPSLSKEINKFQVHYPDNEILLDAYDFNKNYCKLLDFITFDNLCYKAASEIKEFAFNKVKGFEDFW